TLVTGSGDRTIAVWAVARWERQAVLRGHEWPVTCVAFAPDGRTLASASSDGTARLWDLPAGKVLQPLGVQELLPPDLISLAFARNGRMLITQSPEAGTTLWDVATGSRVATLGRGDGQHPAVVFASDGQTLAQALTSGRIESWDLASGRR